MKIDLTHLNILESELKDRLRRACNSRKTFHETCERAETLRALSPNDSHQRARREEALNREAHAKNIRAPLAGLRAIQLARRTVSAMDELEAKYGVRVTK